MALDKLSIDKKEEKRLQAEKSAALGSSSPKPETASSQPKNGDATNAREIGIDIVPLGDTLSESESVVNGGKKKRPFISFGEHFDHWSKYLTVDWIWNATASASFAYWGKFTELGQKLWDKPLNRGFNSILKPFIKDPRNLASSVQWGKNWMSIITGGLIFTIPPLLVLENKKVKLWLVKTYDRFFYGSDEVKKPKFEQAYDEMEHAPEKGFWANFISRYIALAPLLASVTIVTPARDWQEKHLYPRVAAVTKAVATKIGLTPGRLFKKFPHEERTKRWNYVHNEAISMDLVHGLPYAIMHAFWYNVLANAFAGWGAKKKPEEAEKHQAESVAGFDKLAEQASVPDETKTAPAKSLDSYKNKKIVLPEDTHAKESKKPNEPNYMQAS